MFSNVDTLTFEKLQELRVRIDSMDSKPSIIALCEVKPKNFRYERNLAEYNLEGYDLLPYNIGKDDPGRGMLIYILSGVQYSPVNINNDFCEYLSVEIALNSSDKLLVTLIYRSPSSSQQECIKLNNLFKEINEKQYSHILTLGDFNYPGIDWINWVTESNQGDSQYEFIETVRDCYLYQHIQEPTRGRGSNIPSCIDLLFTNEEGMISEINLDSPLGKSDHSLISFQFNSYISANSAPKTRYKYDKGNYSEMKDFLDINWDEYLENENIDTQWTLFCDKLQIASDKYIPKVTINNGNKTRKRHNLPISIKTKAKIKRKQRLWNKYLETGDESYKLQYNRVRNQVRR